MKKYPRLSALALALCVAALWFGSGSVLFAVAGGDEALPSASAPADAEAANPFAAVDTAKAVASALSAEQAKMVDQLVALQAQVKAFAASEEAARWAGMADAGGYVGIGGLLLMILTALGKSPALGRLLKRIPARHRPLVPVALGVAVAAVGYLGAGLPLAAAVALALTGPTAVGLHEVLVEWIGGGRDRLPRDATPEPDRPTGVKGRKK